jgi:hypothetical protein
MPSKISRFVQLEGRVRFFVGIIYGTHTVSDITEWQ